VNLRVQNHMPSTLFRYAIKLLSFYFSLFTSLSLFSQQNPSQPYTTTIPGTSITFTMNPIPAGEFVMGSPDNEAGRNPDEGPARKVQLSAFWMGAREVTYDEFLIYFNDDSVSTNSEADAVTRPTAQYIDLSWGMGKQGGFPVNSMSQHTALMYCRWLYQKTGVFYRLPTEAEWEYACRAGTTTAFISGPDSASLNDYAWHAGNSEAKYHKTGGKKPNAWGLYDIIGNVSEWTIDQYDSAYFTALTDGVKDPITQPGSRYPRSVRGGDYTTGTGMMRSAARFKSNRLWNRRDPQLPKSKWWLTDATAVGFRLVAPATQPTRDEANAFYEKFLTR
jgi:formylglycine-generating enzyme required for sulfatase activity